ncbi:hypothetical protein BGZ99_002229 [Dissophora globulifera]|uniref:Uncharacterized protein n=1 Tax=Dissophora globulifera TaxID=979702 RepID=A0A9P6RMZ9_9FUNG|nr:hypothetical protein BGZ99_002229 [Dissophora globulifera]
MQNKKPLQSRHRAAAAGSATGEQQAPAVPRMLRRSTKQSFMDVDLQYLMKLDATTCDPFENSSAIFDDPPSLFRALPASATSTGLPGSDQWMSTETIRLQKEQEDLRAQYLQFLHQLHQSNPHAFMVHMNTFAAEHPQEFTQLQAYIRYQEQVVNQKNEEARRQEEMRQYQFQLEQRVRQEQELSQFKQYQELQSQQEQVREMQQLLQEWLLKRQQARATSFRLNTNGKDDGLDMADVFTIALQRDPGLVQRMMSTTGPGQGLGLLLTPAQQQEFGQFLEQRKIQDLMAQEKKRQDLMAAGFSSLAFQSQPTVSSFSAPSFSANTAAGSNMLGSAQWNGGDSNMLSMNWATTAFGSSSLGLGSEPIAFPSRFQPPMTNEQYLKRNSRGINRRNPPSIANILGCIEDTLDALIIFEACRQGVLPRIHRRLLEAERGDSNLPTLATMDPSTPAHSTQTQMATVATAGPSDAPTKPERPSSSLITPGSVFVFDEDESGIRRWTDGRIWSPSRICGNFLVYRELFRKLNSEKCLNPKEKARMSDGSGLQDKALREKVEKDNLIVLGCMKGTFVLKRDGLIKKTICVRGVRLPPLDELRKSDRSSSSRAPRYSSTGMQHLVCYEKPGAMESLHRPRAYAELLDLPLSRTFIMMQKYREPIYITPLCIDVKPIESTDEYVSSSRVSRVRDAPKELTNSARRKRLRSLDVVGHSNQQESCSSFRDSDPATMLLSSNKTTAITRHPYPTRSRDRQPLMAEQTLTLAAFSAAHTPESRWSRDLSRSLTATEDLSEISMEDVRESSAELHPNDSLTVRGHKSEDGNWHLIPASILPYMDLSAYRTQSPTSTGHPLEHGYRPEQPSHPDASDGDPESRYFSSKPLSPHGHCAFKSQRLEPKQDRGESVSTGKNLLQLSESGRRWTARNDESQDQADEIHCSLKSASLEPWGGETEEYSLSVASSLSLHAEWSTGSLSSQGSPSPSLSLSPAGNQASNRDSGYSLPESSTPSGQLTYSECRETSSSVYKYPNVPSEIVSPLFTTSSREMYMANDLPEYQGTQGHDVASIMEYESSTSGCRAKPHSRATTHQPHSTSSQAQHDFPYPTERPQFGSRADTVGVAAGSIRSRMLQSLPLVRMHAVSSAGSSLASHVLATPSVRPYPTGGVPLAVAFQPNSEEEGPWGCGTTLIETASLTPAINAPRFSHIGSMSKNYQEQQNPQASDPLAQRIARVHSILPVALQDGYSVLGVKQELDNGPFLSNSSLRGNKKLLLTLEALCLKWYYSSNKR